MLSIPAELTENYFFDGSGTQFAGYDRAENVVSVKAKALPAFLLNQRGGWRGIASGHEACVLPARIRLQARLKRPYITTLFWKRNEISWYDAIESRLRRKCIQPTSPD